MLYLVFALETTEFVELLFATLKDGSYAEFGAKELPQTIKELSVDVPPVVSSAGRIDLENSKSQDTKVLARANVSAVGTSSRGSRRDSLRGNEPRSKSRDRILPGRLGSGSRSHRTSRNEVWQPDAVHFLWFYYVILHVAMLHHLQLLN